MKNPSDEDLEFCRHLAEQLTTIPGFDRPSEDALDAVATDLVKHCESWDEAQVVVEKARTRWERWRGTHGLIELINRHRPAPPAGNEAIDYGPKPPVDCKTCNDFGTFYEDGQNHWCPCPSGEELRTKFPHLVDGLNRKPWKAPAAAAREPARPRMTDAQLKRAFNQRQDQIDETIARNRAILDDANTSAEQKEIARYVLNSLFLDTTIPSL